MTLRCFLFGHRWRIVTGDWRSARDPESIVGRIAFCTRCPANWDDMTGWYLRELRGAQPDFEEYRREVTLEVLR